MHSNVNLPLRKHVKNWLLICLFMVALMVAVGGLTRLTESGLSMVEWKPTTLFPPMNAEEWQEEFGKYQSSPQFQKVNHQMNVQEFKSIFWLEYVHRLLGRLVGFVFFVPYLYFLWRRALEKPLAIKLLGIFLLGGMQGFIGWYMVKSGLIDQPWVSPVRLAMHLSMAFILFGLLQWQWLNLCGWAEQRDRFQHSARIKLWSIICLLALFVQIILGALVAGLDAGLVFNTFPDMNGEYLPQGIWLLEPWYRNFAENPTAAHAIHRYGAVIVTIMLGVLVAGLYQAKYLKQSLTLAGVLLLQLILGTLTVVHAVPIALASLHQVMALILLASVILAVYRLNSRHP